MMNQKEGEVNEISEADFEAQLELLSIIDELTKEKESLIQYRQSNFPKRAIESRKLFANNKNVKSDVKKSNTFVKKIKTINTEGIQQCIRDTETLNLTQYISEIVTALVATTFKAADCSHIVKLCVTLHLKYDGFTEPLIQGLKASLLTPVNEDDPEAGKRKRIQIRFIIELYQAGLCNDDDFFVQLLRLLLGKPNANPSNKVSTKGNLDILSLSTFVKYGNEILLGLLSRKYIDLAVKAHKPLSEMPIKLLASLKNANEMKMLIMNTYEQVSIDLVEAHKEYRTKEIKAEKDKLIHGNLSDTKQTELDQLKKLYERLLSVVTTLSESLGEKMPELIIEKEEEEISCGITVWEGAAGMIAANAEEGINPANLIYGDLESRAFYEDLPDLLSLVPLSILGFTPEQAQALEEEWALKSSSNSQESLQQTDDLSTVEEETIPSSTTTSVAPNLTTIEEGNEEANEIELENEVFGKDIVTDDMIDSTKSAKLTILITEKLPECVNKQKADEFCVSFCYLNSKNARKRLAQAIVRIPRSRTELAPTYARIIASISRLFPDIIPYVLDALKKEFYGILRVRRQLFVDSKVKNVRLQGELIKFKIAPPIVAFRMFKALLGDLSPHHAEMLSVLLETCGRFLYLLPHTHEYMVNILDSMMRLRRTKNLDMQHQTLLESAYFSVKPPERTANHGASTVKSYTVLQKYIQYLLFDKLNDYQTNVDDIIDALRRLPWSEKEHHIEQDVIRYALKMARTKYTGIPSLADCLSGLGQYYPNVLVQVIDRMFEEIQRALEIPYKREIQRILGLTRLLGELYNYTVLPSVLILDFFYHLINFDHVVDTNTNSLGGVSTGVSSGVSGTGNNVITLSGLASNFHATVKYDPRVISELDLPNDLFRAQIVCELLNTVGQYFVTGALKEKLSRFLIYFQRYLLIKQLIPLHIECMLLDTFDQLEEYARDDYRENHLKIMKKSKKNKKKKKQIAVLLVESPEDMIVPIQFPRFDTFEAAQQAVEAMESSAIKETVGEEEEEEIKENNETINPSKETRNKRNKNKSEENDEDDDDDDEDSDDDDDDDDDEDDDEESDSENSDSEDDEESEFEEEDNLSDADLSDNEAKQMFEKMRIAEEDDEFDKAFKAMMQESMASVAVKYQDVNKMAIPAVIPKPKTINNTHNNHHHHTQNNSQNNSTGSEAPVHSTNPHHHHHPDVGKQMSFRLLSRDTKGRIEAKQLLVPENNPMAKKIIETEELAKIEREKLKERVLQIESMNAEYELGYDEEGGVYDGRYFAPREIASSSNNNNNNNVFSGGRGSGGRGGGRGGGFKSGRGSIRAEETRKPADTLNLDEFLAEANAAEIRRITSRKP